MLRPDIFKSGWLYKSASITNGEHWTRGWVELSRDGSLRFFISFNYNQADSIIYLTDLQLSFSSPPNINLPKQTLIPPNQYPILKITTSKNTWLLCAENNDDLTAWRIMFDQIRTNHAENLVFTNIPNLNLNDDRQIVFKDERKPYYIQFQGSEQRIIIPNIDNTNDLFICPFCFPIWF